MGKRKSWYVQNSFHGGIRAIFKKKKSASLFCLLKTYYLIIYRGSQGGRGVSWLKKGAVRIKLFQMCMGIVIDILLYNILRFYALVNDVLLNVAAQLSLNSTSKISWI